MSDGRLIPQRRFNRKQYRPSTAHIFYDPEIPSDGLTVDTPDGPVDLVAVRRIAHGIPAGVTYADVRYLFADFTRKGESEMEMLAGALGVTLGAIKRRIDRSSAERKTA